MEHNFPSKKCKG
uniref:Uncharacterized protein n=1 Tax=Anguilla anguilla TaxID=7936 RepID=A0A0E9UV91_ANGAN